MTQRKPQVKRRKNKDEKKGKKDPKAEEEEEERKQKEEEERIEKEKAKIAEIEKNFDSVKELRKIGGKKLDFFPDDERKKAQHYDWLIPMFFKDSQKPTDEIKKTYLEVRTITLTRTLIPQEEVVDFGEVPVAFRKTYEILIKNIGETEQPLKMEALPLYGGFAVLNARRTLKPGETKPILVEFNPFTQQIYEEKLKLFSDTTVASVTLKGIGVRPEVRIEPHDGLLYFANI